MLDRQTGRQGQADIQTYRQAAQKLEIQPRSRQFPKSAKIDDLSESAERRGRCPRSRDPAQEAPRRKSIENHRSERVWGESRGRYPRSRNPAQESPRVEIIENQRSEPVWLEPREKLSRSRNPARKPPGPEIIKNQQSENEQSERV